MRGDEGPRICASPGAFVLRGIEQGRYRVVIGADAKAMDTLSRVSPRRATTLIATQMAKLLER